MATSLCNHGKLRIAEQDFESAARDLERCVAIREKTIGRNHPYVAGALELYAQALNGLGRANEAIAMQQRAELIRESMGP